MIPAVLEELDGIVADADVVLLVATGTHRGNTDDELRAMLGDEVFERVARRQPRRPRSPARSSTSACTATACRSRSTAAGSRPTCGSRPASSSRTSSPASAAARSSSRPASPASRPCSCCTTRARIGDPRATWGVTHGNPVHDDIRAAASAAPPHFSLDVILNREQRIITAFAGETARDARGRLRRRAPLRDGSGRGAVRRRRHEQLRLPARPEPLPGRQGHVGRREDRQARRHDRLRRRVPRRLPGPRRLPRAARLARSPRPS